MTFDLKEIYGYRRHNKSVGPSCNNSWCLTLALIGGDNSMLTCPFDFKEIYGYRRHIKSVGPFCKDNWCFTLALI